MLLAGPPKIGKSWLALNIAISVATGTKAFGHFETVKGMVLYLAYEDSERRLNQRLNMIIKSKEI